MNHRLGQDAIQNQSLLFVLVVGTRNKPVSQGGPRSPLGLISEFYVLHKNPTQPVTKNRTGPLRGSSGRSSHPPRPRVTQQALPGHRRMQQRLVLLPAVCVGAWALSCSGEDTGSAAAAARAAAGSDGAVRLRFGAPVTLPLYCPQAKCKFGGSVGADSFFGLGGDVASSNIIGSVNRSVVWSSDSGASFVVLPSTVAKEGLASSAVGPGLAVAVGHGAVRTIGGATSNRTLHPQGPGARSVRVRGT